MKVKKVLEFMILKPAFSSRNLTSIALVALFFGVYVIAGGKVTIPNVKRGENFGSVAKGAKDAPNSQHETDIRPTDLLRQAHPVENTAQAGRFSAVQPAVKPVVQTPSAKTADGDKLNELEERLKGLKHKSGE